MFRKKMRKAGRTAETLAGDARLRLERNARDAGRAAEEMVGDARQRLERVADRAAETYAAAREVADSVDPFVKGRPYVSLAIAAAAGLVIGGLFLPPGPKVVLVKGRD